MSDSVQVFKSDHKPLLFMLICCSGIISYVLIRYVTWSSIGRDDVAGILAGSLMTVFLGLLGFWIWHEAVIVNHSQRMIILRHKIYPTHFFDILIKRRFEIPFAEVVSIEQVRGHHQVGWYVYTTRGRFTISEALDDIGVLIRFIESLAEKNQHKRCLPRERAVRFGLWVKCVFVALFVGVVLYVVLVVI